MVLVSNFYMYLFQDEDGERAAGDGLLRPARKVSPLPSMREDTITHTVHRVVSIQLLEYCMHVMCM